MDEQNQNNVSSELINLLLTDGLGEGLPKIAEILMNTAMLLERVNHIGAAPHQRVEQRNGHANGFKPRTFHTAMGPLDLAVPQVRGGDTIFAPPSSIRAAAANAPSRLPSPKCTSKA